VFTKETPESRGALSRLVSAFIGRGVSAVKITANEPAIDNLRDRQIRFDIACQTEKGELVNVEMSLLSDFSDNTCYPSRYIIRVYFVSSIRTRT